MSYKRITSVPVNEGGTGIASATTYAPLCGGTTSTGALQPAATGQATAGFVLTSTGAGSLPTWQAVAGGGGVVTINADTGSATGGTITLAGTANQITTAASGATVTLSLPSAVTAPGSVTVTSGFTVSAGTITLTPLSTSGVVVNNASGVISTAATTQYALQVGSATGQLSSLSTGTSGQIMQSGGASANPAWTTATYPATTAQGDLLYSSAANTVAALTKNTTATRYLANTGTSNNPNWDQVSLSTGVTGTLPVASGGTGDASFTAYAVVCGGTTSTGALQAVSGVGTANQVLTSNGAGALPTWQTVAAAGVNSIAGTSFQISASAAMGDITLSIPSTFIAPGSIKATTSVEATTNLLLPTTSSTAGQLKINSVAFLHAYGTDNAFVGAGAGNFTLSGSENSGFGDTVLAALTSGSNNTAVGSMSLMDITSGSNNTAIGRNAGGMTTGSRNTLLGHSTGSSYASSESDNILIGFSVNGTASESNVLRIGSGTGTGNGQLNLSHICGIYGKTSSSGTAVFISSGNVLGTTTSSLRYKTRVADIGSDSDLLMSLRPVSFHYKDEVLKERGDTDIKQYGLIAEEVVKLDPELVMLDANGKPDAVRYHFLVPMLLNELQKAVKRIDELEKLVKA